MTLEPHFSFAKIFHASSAKDFFDRVLRKVSEGREENVGWGWVDEFVVENGLWKSCCMMGVFLYRMYYPCALFGRSWESGKQRMDRFIYIQNYLNFADLPWVCIERDCLSECVEIGNMRKFSLEKSVNQSLPFIAWFSGIKTPPNSTHLSEYIFR